MIGEKHPSTIEDMIRTIERYVHLQRQKIILPEKGLEKRNYFNSTATSSSYSPSELSASAIKDDDQSIVDTSVGDELQEPLEVSKNNHL